MRTGVLALVVSIWMAAMLAAVCLLAVREADAESETKPLVISKPIAEFRHAKNWIRCVAFSPDGKILAAAAGGRDRGKIYLWEMKTKKLYSVLSGHKGLVFYVAFSPDGKTLASGGEDKTVRLWDVSKKKLRAVISDVGPAVPAGTTVRF